MPPPQNFSYDELVADDDTKITTPANNGKNGPKQDAETTTAVSEPSPLAPTNRTPTALVVVVAEKESGTATDGTPSEEGDGTAAPDAPASTLVVGAVGAGVLAATQAKGEKEEEPSEVSASVRSNSNKNKESAPVEVPFGLTARQTRLFLRNELKKALAVGDIERSKAINALQDVHDDRHERRVSRDGGLRKADRENPYDKHLLDIYADADIAWCVHKYSKAVRWDASGLGLVGGVAFILETAARTAGAPVAADVLHAQVKAMCWKIKERINGLGKEWVTDGNQIMRLEAASRGQRVPEDKWLRRHPLPGPDAWDIEFEEDWQKWLSKVTPKGEA